MKKEITRVDIYMGEVEDRGLHTSIIIGDLYLLHSKGRYTGNMIFAKLQRITVKETNKKFDFNLN